MKGTLYAEIIVNNRCIEVDKIFHYSIPEDITYSLIGFRVLIPFGNSNKLIEGYVIGITNVVKIDKAKIKQIKQVLKPGPLITSAIINLIKWMKEEYFCYYIDAIHTAVPACLRGNVDYKIELIQDCDISSKIDTVSSKILNSIINILEENSEGMTLDELSIFFDNIKLQPHINQLKKLGIIRIYENIKDKRYQKKKKKLYIDEEKKIIIPTNAKKQRHVFDIILQKPGITTEQLIADYDIRNDIINVLIKKNAVKVVEEECFGSIKNTHYENKNHTLTDEQKSAIESINKNIELNKHTLLHGVTGSGKTEVYMQLINEQILKGKDSIVLVPEIALTPQTIGRFKSVFGDSVAVLHSGLSNGEKYDEWKKIQLGIVKVVVGARSAVFAPFSNLGLIIIDEEHENTYKSEMSPKYLTKEVAQKRCELEGAHMVLGSATPSVETYYDAMNGKLGLVKMNKRVNNKSMPIIDIIDMREELKSGNNKIFSKKLNDSIIHALQSEQKIIIFLNRRGFSTFVSCRQCGFVIKCPSCSISLTYHITNDKLTCHYCGYEMSNVKSCPKCNSKHIKYFGIGTQKVESEFIKEFNYEDVVRMDADTTSTKNSHEKILDEFRLGNKKVLIGTQMISKGLDFPQVTLVGIVAADTSLNLPDYKSSERTFQMITQVAGRAGRGEIEGKVILQTYQPEHYSLQYAKKYDYIGFINQELKLRKELRYPPYTKIANIIISGYNEENVEAMAKKIGIELDNIKKQNKELEVLGPVTAPLFKIKNRYRWQIILKGERGILREVVSHLIYNFINSKKDININIDLNPINLL